MKTEIPNEKFIRGLLTFPHPQNLLTPLYTQKMKKPYGY